MPDAEQLDLFGRPTKHRLHGTMRQSAPGVVSNHIPNDDGSWTYLCSQHGQRVEIHSEYIRPRATFDQPEFNQKPRIHMTWFTCPEGHYCLSKSPTDEPSTHGV